MVYTYFEIGRMIVEDEQQGKDRAEYGKQVLKELSKQLTADFGKGFSEDNLGRMKNFHLIYSNPISAKGLRKLETAGTNSSLISQRSFAELQQSESNDIIISSNLFTKFEPSENNNQIFASRYHTILPDKRAFIKLLNQSEA